MFGLQFRNYSLLQIVEKYSVGGGPTQISRVKYVTQVSSRPPKFLIFLGGSQPFPQTSSKFLENALRQDFGFAGVPLRIDVRVREPRRLRGGATKEISSTSQPRQA